MNISGTVKGNVFLGPVAYINDLLVHILKTLLTLSVTVKLPKKLHRKKEIEKNIILKLVP